MNKLTKLACAFSLPALIAAQAHGAILIDDFTVDLSTVGGPTINNVDSMGFVQAPISATLNDLDMNGLDVGDTYDVSGLGTIGLFSNDSTGIVGVAGAFLGYEMTFSFDLEVLVTEVSGTEIDWVHLAGTNVLSLFIDSTPGGVGGATPGTGAGYEDGTLVATFDVLFGNGGGVDLASGVLDGSDDVTFLLNTVNTAGVLLDGLGNELVAGETLAFANSNFDLDNNNNGIPDETAGGFGCTATNQSAAFFCGLEDGTINFAKVPEPSTVLLLGMGLLGLGSVVRRNKA